MRTWCGGRYNSAMRSVISSIVVTIAVGPVSAGLHSATDVRNALPAKWRGFLPDHRALRMAAVDPARSPNLPPSPLRDRCLDRVLTLDGKATTADQFTDLSEALIRLDRPDRAIGVLRTARRKFPDDFRLAANLGTAYQRSGDLDLALAALDDAIRLAPDRAKRAERLHRTLVAQRKAERGAKVDAIDALVTVATATADDLADVQQLALTLPADGRLLWLLGELAFATGDVRTGANILDGCAAEFGLSGKAFLDRRKAMRAAADALDAKDDHNAKPGRIAFASARPLGSLYDAGRMPAIRKDGVNALPWPAILETTVGKGFTPKFVDHVEKLDGLTVTLTGYPASSGDDAEGSEFLLTESPIGCWFCESPEPLAIVKVELARAVEPGQIGKGFVKITGTLTLNRTDPERFVFSVANAKFAGVD
jgi:hypothetical protein